MNPSDISNDYSFLVHSIEGRLTSASTSSKQTGPKVSDENVAREDVEPPRQGFPSKRKRASEFVIDDLDDDNLAPPTASKTVASAAIRSTSSTMKMQAQLDEYKLLNEQLKEQLRTYRDEHDLFKEQSIRQIKYLEDQNTRYKSQYEQSSQKYYKEKKEWQVKVRELEHSLEQQPKAAASSTSGKSSAAVLHELTSDEEKEYRAQILQLKETLVEKSQEASTYFTAKLDLEKKVYQLEQEVKCLKSTTSNDEETVVELRSLRKKCSELETTLRRKSREYEKYDQKLKNQSILEEEVATANHKLSLAQNSIKTYQAMEVQYSQLLEEKKVWTQLFMNVVSQSQPAEGNTITAEDCTASRVLQLLHNTQQSLLTLQQQHSELQNSLVGLRRQLLKAETQCRDYETKMITHSATIQQLESKLNQSSAYMKCFEGEIKSLRTLLSSYDMEFQLGKPQESTVLTLKESAINDLRTELDVARETLKSYKSQVDELQLEVEKVKTQAAEAAQTAVSNAVANAGVATTMVEEEKFQSLRDDFQALQEITGMDYLPHKTQVLHLADNPTTALMKHHAAKQSSLPMEVIQRLRQEVKTLKSAPVAAVSTATATAGDAENNSGDASLFVDMNRSAMITSAAAGSSSSAVVDHAKLNIRLKEIFKEKIQSYREAVYLLTGFKMDLYTEDPSNPNSLPRIRLRSMYAESPDDFLIFQLRDKTPELLETDFAISLSPDLMNYLGSFNSIPAFLANVTLQLFENQTQM